MDETSKEKADLAAKLDKVNLRLDEVSDMLKRTEKELTLEQEKSRDLARSFERERKSLEAEGDKFKRLYESMYHQYNQELRTWEENLSAMEKQRDDREAVFAEETRRKERVVSDLSEQLKESEDRIQELYVELERVRESNEDLRQHSEQSFSRLVVSMEEKFEETMKAEKEQMELAFKQKMRDHDLYDRLAAGGIGRTTAGATGSASPMSSAGSRANSRRPSLVKIESMSELMALKAPSLESLDTMEAEEVKEKFVVLLDHFYAAVDEIRTLRSRMNKSQEAIDALEIDKLRFEESFKRTIVMQEQQENLMSQRIQDLTNKLLVAEKNYRQLKERRHSRKSSIAKQQQQQALQQAREQREHRDRDRDKLAASQSDSALTNQD